MDRENRIGRLDGVIFPTRRRTIGQAGGTVAKLCTAIIEEEGSGVKIAKDHPQRTKVIQTRYAEASLSSSLSLIWNNPRVAIQDIFPNLTLRLQREV